MSDPYRQAAYRCLHCEDAPLRAYGDRLVCDTCGGILLEVADLEAAIADLAPDPVVLLDQEERGLGCPRCARKVVACRLAVGKLWFDAPLLRCRDHGVWFEGDQLAGVFERIGRSQHRGAGHGRSYGGVGGGLALHRAREKRSPRPMFGTAYRDQRLACPACEHALGYTAGRWGCTECLGVFVEDAALATMVAAMTSDPWELPELTGAAGQRACPICAAKMIVEPLEGVTVDRCAGHGVWFDPHELASALAHTTEPAPRGLRAWLRSLF